MSASPTLDRLQTARLICERLRVQHLPEVSRLLLDPSVGRTLWHGSEPPSEQELVEGLLDKERHWERYGFGLWLLRDRLTGEMVGRGGLQWTCAVGPNEIEAAWAIVPKRWRQGLATELAQAAIETAFGPLGLAEIVAFTLEDNLASRRVMEKTGFIYERETTHVGLPHVLYRRTAPV
jgi:RimJ/RimL family protein N-acetyltransferase